MKFQPSKCTPPPSDAEKLSSTGCKCKAIIHEMIGGIRTLEGWRRVAGGSKKNQHNVPIFRGFTKMPLWFIRIGALLLCLIIHDSKM